MSMPSVKVYSLEGKAVGTKTLPDEIFGLPVRPEVVQQAVLAQRANARQPIAHTKTRAEVRGGGKKPWRQKGTGRARHGSIRSPLWKGGGVTFGPRNTRNFSLKLNKKVRRQALFMALSDKVAADQLVLLESLQLPAIKTKVMATLLKKLPVGASILLVLPGKDESVVKSSRNISGLTPIRGDSLNVIDVLRHQSLLMPTSAIETIVKTFHAANNPGRTE